MSVDNTLVVPVEVAALAVNRQTRDTGSHHVIHRWRTNFKNVAQGVPPEPEPFSSPEKWTGREDRLGVYLQWELPAALKRGRHDEDDGVGDFPIVPNRWLVVRHQDSTRTLKAWVVESDFLDPMNGTVSFQNPDTEHPEATLIGKCHELTGAWTEPGNRHEPFLTAVGPGLLTFSVFQPYNENVFSMHDRVEGVRETERLSYFVAGWYADPGSDILAGTENLADTLRGLDWTQPVGSGSGIRNSVYSGYVLGLDWQLDGQVPESDCPRREDVTPIVANSVMEAMGELNAMSDGVFSADEADLFRAFLLGGTEALAEQDRPDADILTDRRSHDIGFGPVPGGYRWFIGARAEIPDNPLVQPSVRSDEATVLAALNEKQARHDETERDLTAARERLYQLWWLTQLEDRPAEFDDAVEGELEAARARVVELAADLTEQRSVLPWGRSADDLAASIDAKFPEFSARSARRLIRSPQQDFEYAADPVLALDGANLHAPLVRDTPLPCRTPERLVTRASGVSVADVSTVADQANLTRLPACFRALLAEFLILDRARKTGSITQVTGLLPEFGTEAWRMPWQPLYLLWKAQYFPLPFRDGDGDHWEFIERSRYRWKGSGTPGTQLVVAGRQTLAPAAGHILEGELAGYADGRSALDEDTVRRLRSDARNTNVLSQTLDGFGAGIAQRQALSGLQPPADVAALLGDVNYTAPDPGGMPASDWAPWPESKFQELRAGQMAFLDLAVVDRFGRAVNLVGDPMHFRPEMVRTMVPQHPVTGYDSGRLIELGPRLLQPARLRFDFLAATGDQDVELTPGSNPVCAWLIHNRLDRSVVVHAPDGTVWGELRVTMNTASVREVSWTALPGSQITDFEQLRTASRHAYDFLKPVKDKGPDTFDAFRATVDSALQTIDPDGPADPGLGFLLGRPLALVRSRLTMEIHGPLAQDVSWQHIITETERQLPSYDWYIRMGEGEQADDGLVGYAADNDYEHFETVVDPVGNSGGYLRPIGDVPRLKLKFGAEGVAVLTILLDPRAAVHATTDVLATKNVSVPQEFTDRAIARMSVNFRTGPLLAGTAGLQDAEGQVRETVLMPVPTGSLGEWTWSENHRGRWEKLPILAPDPYGLPLAEPEIRSGFLTLDNAAQHARAEA
ncbi:hypothetical protein [Streptomyces sp. NPDC059122]|uniref:hypothetical protein n=1 Tax=Streptomyces sp. NPDC059122 TaxID=3346732 RepID=UPI003688C37B